MRPAPVTGAPGAGCAMVVPPPRHHPGSTQSQFCRECVPRGGETGHVVEEPEAGARKGMTGAQRAQIWRTLLETLPPLIWALAALINVLLGR